MPALRAGDVMASLTRRTFPFGNGNVNKGGTARLIIPALSFEKDRAVFIARGLTVKHYVLMRLKPGVFDEQAERDYRETFEKLREALPKDVLSVSVRRNVVDRPQNMTVMIEMTLKDQDSLKKYLTHPLHIGIGQRYNPFVEAIASFDCE